MPDFRAIYHHQAAKDDLMGSREDYQGSLLPELPTDGLAAFYQSLENEYSFGFTALPECTGIWWRTLE